MPVMLPDAVQQQLGFMPSPTVPLIDASSSMPSFLPSITAIKATPPPAAPASAPVPPSMESPPQLGADALSHPVAAGFGPGAPPDRDYHVPIDAILAHSAGAAQAPPHAAAPKLPSPDQQLANAQGKQNVADQASLGAIDTQEAVSRAKAASDLAAFSAHDANAQKLEADRKSWQDEYAKTHQQKQAYVDATLKDVNSFHVDPKKFEHELGLGGKLQWGIAMILSGVGEAMQGHSGPNPVLQMLQEKMHASVVAQMDQRDQLKEKAGRAEHQLDKYDAFSQSREAQMNLLDARNDKLLASTLLTSAAKYADPQAQANAQAQASQLLQSSAEKGEKAAQFAAGNDLQKKQLAISQSANAIAGGHLALAQRAENRAQKLQDLEYGPGGFKEQELGLKAAEEMRKALATKKQAITDNGIFNPITGNGLLTARGKEMTAAADQVEAISRNDPAKAALAYIAKLRSESTTPQVNAQIDQLENQIKTDPEAAKQVAAGYAAQLRDTANTGEVATISDKEDRRKVSDALWHAQTLIDTSGKIKEFLRGDPDITDREGWAKLQAQYGTAKADYIESIGARASSREFDAISNHIMKYDPDSWLDRGFRKAPGVASLEGLDESVKAGVDAMLKSKGIKDGWVPSAGADNPAATFGGKTAAELGADETPGAAVRAALRIANPFGPVAEHKIQAPQDAATEAALARTNAAGQSSNYGLDPADDSKASALINKAHTAGNAERSRIIEQLTAPILQQNRPSLAAGLLNLVHDRDPEMYREILGRLPQQQAEQIQQMNAVRSTFPGASVGPQTPTSMPSDAVRAYNSQLEAQGLPPIHM